ncbi:CRE-DHFR-1 protein [Caenorhabditis remanei]|uniref:dihydrofolate reductase n=1 Tax=Caenorhabditis remanei TaxID=31234 RepID=E3LVK9_CAERE|nr:CRE-DHFR-1 protein [Caenorhabditis remanei]
MRRMNLIVAMDSEGGIGKNGTLPWRIKKDMQYFASVTKQVTDPSKRNAVLMGRKCWESIPESRRPLAGRLNIVLSRQLPEQKTDNLIFVNSLEAALKLLAEPPFVETIETIWNIGGAEIYDLALREKLVDEIYLTRVFKNFEADVHLKSLDINKMEKIISGEVSSENSEIFEENGLQFEFGKWKIA